VSSAPIVVRKQADIEMDDIARFIARDNLDAGKRFYDAVYGDLQKLAAMPGIGALREVRNPDLKGLRSWPVSGYRNYLIFYRPIDGGIEVMHILHGARDYQKIIEQG
jgi:toxin ParE1/3/4